MSFPPRFHIRRPKTFLLPLLLAAFTASAALHAAALTHHTQARPSGPAVMKSGNTLYMFSDRLKITLSPVPFHDMAGGDFIIREFVVQNDTPDPVDIKIVLKFTVDSFRDESNERTVTTERKIPAHSPPQTIHLFIPAGFPVNSSDSGHFHGHYAMRRTSIFGTEASIYVNGEEIRQSLPGLMDTNAVEENTFPIPPSFGKEEELVHFLRSALSGHDYSPFFWHLDRQNGRFEVKKTIEPVVADCDASQWPAVPQFYQSKNIIFRKSSDKFPSSAERAISDAVMLGSTELLLVMPGDPWPDWAPQPSEEGLPVIVRRGLGQSVAVRADAIHVPQLEPSGPGMPADALPADSPEEVNPAPVHSPEGGDPATWEGVRKLHDLNPDFEDELTRANIWTVNPALLFMALPHVRTPSVPFALIQLALLAYIIIVGPVNYLVIRKKKKSLLMLLLTVPAISIVFVALVFLFVGIVEGWYSRASAVGVTFLDQRTKTAYTRAGVNLYASFPVRKMKFDPADSVTFSGMKNLDISLGSEQVIAGPNQARIPLAYTISRAERQRLEQLKITRNADGGISVMNGLGIPLKSLVVKLEDGRIWTAAAPVPPGENVALTMFTGELPSMEKITSGISSALFAKRPGDVKFPFNNLLLTASALLFEVPADSAADDLNDIFRKNIYGDLRDINPDALLAAKKALQDPDVVKAVLPPGLYMAETDKPAFYSPGCSPTSFRARHIVFGNFTVQEAKTNEN